MSLGRCAELRRRHPKPRKWHPEARVVGLSEPKYASEKLGLVKLPGEGRTERRYLGSDELRSNATPRLRLPSREARESSRAPPSLESESMLGSDPEQSLGNPHCTTDI